MQDKPIKTRRQKTSGEFYRPGALKRKRLTRAGIRQLENQILKVLKSDHPQSVRHVFYRMTDPRLKVPVEKTESGYRQVKDRLVKMRRSGAIPYGWISDATRQGRHVHTFENGGDLIGRFAGLYRANLWAHCPCHVEVWCESRSIAGVIQEDCNELAVSLYPAGGFSSLTLAYDAAKLIQYHIDNGKVSAEIVYVGDFDPAGLLIDQSIKRELRNHLPYVSVTVHRVAINEDQIAEYDLPTRPRKATDRRRLDVQETVEAEAMPARTLRGLLREKVESFLPAGALEKVQKIEESEREGLRLLAGNVEVLGLDQVNGILEAE